MSELDERFNQRSRLAWELLTRPDFLNGTIMENHAMTGSDYQPRLQTPNELVIRAFAIVDAFLKEAEK